jgi:hypothetical protein
VTVADIENPRRQTFLEREPQVSMLRIIVIAAVAIVAGAFANVALNAHYPLKTPQSVVVSTLASLCTEYDCIPAIAFDDHDGNLYAIDAVSQRVDRVTPSGKVSPIAGSAYTNHIHSAKPSCLDRDGRGVTARFCGPTDIAYEAFDHTLLIADEYNNAIRKVSEDGQVSTIEASGPTAPCWDFAYVLSHICRPRRVAVDSSRRIVYAIQGQAVMRVGRRHQVAVMSGSDPLGWDLSGCFGHNGGSVDAVYCGAGGLAVSPTGTVYVSEGLGDVVDAIAPDGSASMEAGERSGFFGSAAPSFTPPSRWWRILGPLPHLVPQAFWEWAFGCSARDGQLKSSRFCGPGRLAADQSRDAFAVAEPYSHTIRLVETRSDAVSTIVGYAGDSECRSEDGVARDAVVCDVTALAFDSRNHLLYVMGSGRLRRIVFP